MYVYFQSFTLIVMDRTLTSCRFDSRPIVVIFLLNESQDDVREFFKHLVKVIMYSGFYLNTDRPENIWIQCCLIVGVFFIVMRFFSFPVNVRSSLTYIVSNYTLASC